MKSTTVPTRIANENTIVERTMVHHPLEAALVLGEQPVVAGFGDLVRTSVLLAVLVRPQEAARQHRRERERHEARHENRHRDHDGELVEQPSDDSAEEQNRDEHGGERDRHRENRESDFRRAVHRRAHRRLSHLHVADDVLEHHDRVVDDEADGERERHQRQDCRGCSRAGTSPRTCRSPRSAARGSGSASPTRCAGTGRSRR